MILLVSSTILIMFGLIENYTNWFFSPIKCYKMDVKSNSLRENNESKDFCIEHVYLPYQEKQGSVQIGVSSQLNNGDLLYTITTFWIAKDLGDDNFSDVAGDFTTDVVRRYNQHGLLTFDKLDYELPNDTAPYSLTKFRQYCKAQPILLNGLFMSPECIAKQKMAWEKIQKVAPVLLTRHSIPLTKLSFRWILSNPYKILAAIFCIYAWARFYPIVQSKMIRVAWLGNTLSANVINEKIRQSYKEVVQFTYLIAIISGIGFILNNTIYLIPANLLCLDVKKFQNRDYNRDISSNLEVAKVCINEVLSPFNSYQGAIKIGMFITYTNSTKIVTETVMFVSEDDNFKDVVGDMMHSKISYYGKNGIIRNRSEEIIGEQLAKLMPNNVEKEIWMLVKTKFTGQKEIMYLSVQRVLGEVVEDSLPFLFAAYALLYAYSLYLTLFFGPDSTKNVNEKNDKLVILNIR